MNVLMVVAWISMVTSIFFGVYTIISKSDVSGVLMVFCLVVWVASGLSYIRIRRSKRRIITVIQ